MILIAYGCLVVVLAVFLIRGRGFRLSRRAGLLARLLGMIAATATASIAVFLIAANRATTVGLVVLFSLFLGSLLYLCGLALWQERSGFALRLTGWILVVSALAVPSTLTLLLPVACLLALALSSAPEDRRLAIKPTHH